MTMLTLYKPLQLFVVKYKRHFGHSYLKRKHFDALLKSINDSLQKVTFSKALKLLPIDLTDDIDDGKVYPFDESRATIVDDDENKQLNRRPFPPPSILTIGLS